MLTLSATVGNHNDDNELPEKQQTSCRSCENILKASFFEMSPRNWLKTTLFEVCKKGADTLCSYHVDHTNNKMNVKTLFTNHFKSCFFQTKACLAWKLLDFLPWSAEHYGTSNCTKDLFNCVCNTPNFVFQLTLKLCCFFQSVENNFLRFNWLKSIGQYGSSCYMHSFQKDHGKLNLGSLMS